MKIIICGGHHNSALVVAKALKEKGHEIYWFGCKYPPSGKQKTSAEYNEVTGENIPFTEIKAGKFQPKYNFFRNLSMIPLGFWQSIIELKRIKPDLIFSFGGYIALPVAYGGWLLKIPVITHEQTVVCGISNQFISVIARKIFISFDESFKCFPKRKTVYSGLPTRPEINNPKKLFFKNKKNTIYITGGKQGSHLINELIFGILPELLKQFNIIHQCGSNRQNNDFQKAEEIKEKLGFLANDYLVKEYFYSDEIGSVLHSADFLISRAGAHTVYELLLLQKPAILIPIFWSNNKEQTENALYFEKTGLGKILKEDGLTETKLLEEILAFDKNIKQYSLKKEINLIKNPTDLIIKEIENMF